MGRKAARRGKASASTEAPSPPPPLASPSPSHPRDESEARLMTTSALLRVLIDADLVGPLEPHTSGYFAVLWRFQVLLQPTDDSESTEPRPEDVIALLRGNLLEILVQLLEYLAYLNHSGFENEDVFKDSAWFQALNILRALSNALEAIRGRQEYGQTIARWSRHMSRMAAVFAAHPSISLPEPPTPKWQSYNTTRMLFLESLRSGITTSGHTDVIPTSPSDLRSLIPFLAALRRSMVNGSLDPSEVSLNAAMFAMCLAGQEERLKLRDLTGLTFRELLVPCLRLPTLEDVADMSTHLVQCNLLQLIIRCEDEDAILETIHMERIITHTSSLVKQLRKDPRSRRLDIETTSWFDLIVVLWEAILCRAGTLSPAPIGGKLLTEVLESRIIFQLEYWSVSSADDLLLKMAALIRGCTLCALIEDEPFLVLVLYCQIRIVCRRLSVRSDVRPEVLNTWMKEYKRGSPRPSEAPLEHQTGDETICAAIGCDLIDSPPSTVCGRCRDAHYCSRACQKFDWKYHKLSCWNVA